MNKMILLFFLCLSCNDTQTSTQPLEPCEEASQHIYDCLGYAPYLPNCTDERAQQIINTPCERLESLWE